MAKISITKEQIEDAVRVEPTMYRASKLLGVTYTSFIRYAKKHNLYTPNQGGKGTKRKTNTSKVPLEDILNNARPCSSTRLKKRLLEAGLKKEECEACGIPPLWNGKRLVLQLDHRDGNNRNNMITNLSILCPNCHSQTATYCRGQGKNGNTLAPMAK